MAEMLPPNEQERERRRREIVERAAMTPWSNSRDAQAFSGTAWGSASSQFVDMLRAHRGGRGGFSWRDCAASAGMVVLGGLLLGLLGTSGEPFYFRVLLPGAVAFGVLFWAANRWGASLGALAGLPLAYPAMTLLITQGIVIGRP
jgi:hypothetical protein